MKPTPTAQHFTDNPSFVSAYLAKLGKKFSYIWEPEDWGRAAMQAVLDEDIDATDIRAYSPVMTEAQVNSNVPAGWPDNMITPMTAAEVPATYDDDGNELTPYVPPVYGDERRKKFSEYTYAYEVTGGWVVRFTARAVGVWFDPATAEMKQGQPHSVKNLNTNQFSVWVGIAGGFQTEAEVAAIRITD